MADKIFNSSGEYLSRPQNRYEEQPILPVNLKKPAQIYNEEPKPEIVIEPIPEPIPEVIIEPTVVEEKVEPPKINPYNIRFNYNKPDGWDRKEKKLNIFQIAWFGITGKEMDASEQRKFDNVIVGDGVPILVLILIFVVAFCIISFSSSFNTKYVEGRDKNNDVINKCIDYFVDKFIDKNDNKTIYIDTVKVNNIKTYRDTIEIEPIKAEPQEEVQPEPQPIVDTIIKKVEVDTTTKIEQVMVKPQESKKGFDKESLYRYYDSIKKARKN